jgi:hypothetical protein
MRFEIAPLAKPRSGSLVFFVDVLMVFQHDESRNGLCYQQFHAERYGKIARPFVEETGYRLDAQTSAAYPRPDYREEYRQQKNGTQDIYRNGGTETVAVPDDFLRKPFGGFVGEQNQRDNRQPQERDYRQNVRPHPQTESEFKTGNQRSDDVHGYKRNDNDEQREFPFAARQLHIKVHRYPPSPFDGTIYIRRFPLHAAGNAPNAAAAATYSGCSMGFSIHPPPNSRKEFNRFV